MSNFPRPPRQDIDWAEQSADTNVHPHIESYWTAETGQWSEPQIVTEPYFKVHSLATVFHFGQQVFEGLKAFRHVDGSINIVRPDYHARRLNHSSDVVSMPAVPVEHFQKCVQLAVGINDDLAPPLEEDSMLYIRPVVFGTGRSMRLKASEDYLFSVMITTAGSHYDRSVLDCLIMEDFDRAAPRGTGSAKLGGNYAPVMKWSKSAASEGYSITLHLDSQTRTEIEEFSTSAFIGVLTPERAGGKTTLVMPDSKNVVNSVTNDCVRQLAPTFGWGVVERSIKYEELANFSEVIACGTAVTVLSIKSITRKSTGDEFVYQNASDEPGPCASKLRVVMHDIYKGKAADTFGWLVRVEEPPKALTGN